MKRLVFILLTSFFFFNCASKRNLSDGTIYKNAKNRFLIDSIYDSRLKVWPVPYEEIELKTDYGIVNIIASGEAKNPPIFLIHPMGVTATVWAPNLSELSKYFRVYAINTIGDLGRSELDNINNYPESGADYARWLDGIANQLDIDKVDVVGASMGGWITMHYSINSEKVNRVVLIGPMGIKANTLGVMRRLTRVLINPSDNNKNKLVDWTLGNNQSVVSEMADYMNIAMNCEGKMPIPKRISKKDLKRINAPVLLILGENDNPIGEPKRNARFAQKVFNEVDIVTLNSGHLISFEKADKVNELIILFLKSLRDDARKSATVAKPGT